jgi:hypothetical protein
MIVVSPVPALASGPNTTYTTTDGVVVRTENGATYLTTEVTSGPVRTYRTRNIIQLPLGFARDFGSYISGVLNIVMAIAALLVFFYLIWGGFDWIMSGGDKGNTDKARQKIFAAVIGIVILASSYAVLTIVLNFLGFRDINDLMMNSGTIYGVPERRIIVTPAPSPTPTL